MRKAFHIAGANILRNKSAALALFVIVMIISSLTTVGLSIVFGVEKDFRASSDRLNSFHSLFVMSREDYLPSFEAFIKDDPRVSRYEIGEALLAQMKINYGGEIDINVLLLDLGGANTISTPAITKQDAGVPRESAVYLPIYAEGLGYKTGDPFPVIYRNKLFALTVAGFFESNECSVTNGMCVKLYAAGECYEMMAQYIQRSVCVMARCFDPDDSGQFTKDFTGWADVDFSRLGFGSLAMDWETASGDVIIPTLILTTIILIFSLLILVIALMVTRFRVANSIEGSLHEIGVMKASGYTSAQIAACYLTEYGLVSVVAALAGLALPVPLFVMIRQALTRMTGVTWYLGVNPAAGLAGALCIVFILEAMVARSCRRIKGMTPVDALRSETTAGGFRRNHFPLRGGAGNVHLRLGLKNIFAHSRFYIMTGAVIAGISLALTLGASLYQNMVLDTAAFIQMVGVEVSDARLTVSRHVDADALAAELAALPEVRHVSMLDWITIKVDEFDTMSFTSGDYSQMEYMRTHEGRFPKYDNEIAIPKLLADRIGKKIGDSIKVRGRGVSLDYIITGFFSTTDNSGEVAHISLEGYQRLDPDYRRNSINVYLRDGVTVERLSEILTQNYGVVNVYKQGGDGRFSAAKARAEEKISYYLEYYNIDSVEYAVFYQGEIVMSGSSGAYQIEKIEDVNELLKSQIGTYANVVVIICQAGAFISAVLVSLVLSMTVRQIITKRRRELGIMKSAGFTTAQLAAQLTISFLPCAFIGVLVGCVSGAILVNPAFTAMFGSTGVYNANIYANLPMTAALGALALLYTLAAANVAAIRIRHISVYELISE